MRSNRRDIFSLLALGIVIISIGGCTRITIKQPTARVCNVPSFSDQSEVKHVLKVVSFQGNNAAGAVNSATNSEMKVRTVARLLDKATKAAREGEGNDFACKISFTMPPPKTEVPNRVILPMKPLTTVTNECLDNGKICTETDLEKVVNSVEKGTIILVNDLNWCGETALDTFWGCTKNKRTVIESACQGEICPESESILWLHEFGHVMDRPDRNDNDPRPYVMSGVIDSQNTRLTECDCEDLRKNIE